MEEARTKGGVACCDILRFRRNGSAWHKAPWTLDGTGAKSLRAAAIRTLRRTRNLKISEAELGAHKCFLLRKLAMLHSFVNALQGNEFVSVGI